jgi:hypothetical protein
VKPQRFYAAGPIAGMIVDGDVKMAGIGTVTWVQGDRFLAFGHPFMGTGVSNMPVGNAHIVTTVASLAGSWKMGQATVPVGRLTDDRLHAIAGTMGDLPRTVPVDLSVDLWSPRKGADAKATYHFEVMDHPTDTPLFSAIAIANALQGRVTAENGGTFDVLVDVTTSRGDRVLLPARIADDTLNPAVPTALAVLAGVSNVVESDFAEVKLQSLKVTVRGRSDVELARIMAASTLGAARAGEEAELAVQLLPWRKEGGLIPLPRSYRDQLEQATLRAPPGSLSVYLVRDEESPRLMGETLPGLPPSLRQVTAGTGGFLGGGMTELRATRVARTTVSAGVIVGDATARLEVIE